MNEVEKSVDPRLWHAYAGAMIQMQPKSYVYYFPQGHAEQTHANVTFGNISRDPCILCKVIDIKFMIHLESEEVYAKIRLSPVNNVESNLDIVSDKLEYIAKTLSRTDAIACCLSVPKDKAEKLFPEVSELDYYPTNKYTQDIIVKDIHGENWVFKHVCRGTERRHTLTAGWIEFVRKKKLVKGDSVVFARAEDGDLYVGCIHASSSGSGRVRVEDVIEAASLAVNGQEFEVTYYPRTSPEFVVKAASVNAAERAQWKAGMRVLMSETKDLLKRDWLMGTIASVEDVDPFQWNVSPWRHLKVKWDNSQHETRVSPWLVEVVPIKPKQTNQQVDHPSGSGGNANDCEVVLESDDYERATIDLYVIGSYEEFKKTLIDMFGIELDDWTYVRYNDSAGDTKRMSEDVPYSEFVKTKKLTVVEDVPGDDE